MKNENKNEINESSPQPKHSPIVSVDNVPQANGVGEISNVCTPPKILTSMYLTRLGVILSNLSIVTLAISLSSIVTVVATMFTMIFGFMLMIISVGTVFIIIPNYWHRLISSAEVIGKVNEVIFKIWPAITIVGIVSAVASIICLCFDKTRSHIARIVVSGVVIACIVIFALFMIIGGAK